MNYFLHSVRPLKLSRVLIYQGTTFTRTLVWLNRIFGFHLLIYHIRANVKSESRSNIVHVSCLLFLIYLWARYYSYEIPKFRSNWFCWYHLSRQHLQKNNFLVLLNQQRDWSWKLVKHFSERSFHEFRFVGIGYQTEDKIVRKTQFLVQMMQFWVPLTPRRHNFLSGN